MNITANQLANNMRSRFLIQDFPELIRGMTSLSEKVFAKLPQHFRPSVDATKTWIQRLQACTALIGTQMELGTLTLNQAITRLFIDRVFAIATASVIKRQRCTL